MTAADPAADSRTRLRLALRPHVALVGLTACALNAPGAPEDHIAVTERISHADAEGPGQDAWRADTRATLLALDADPDVRALRQRLFDAGIASGFAADHDKDGLWASLVLSCPPEALPRLEALAADDARIDPDERAEASEQFVIYMLRNHHPEWQANRQQMPDVGDSPYTPAEERTLLDT